MKDQLFCEMVARRMGRGWLPKDAALDVVPRLWRLRDPEAVERMAMVKLRQPEVVRVLGETIADVTGFTHREALDLWVRHIRGEIERPVVTKAGVTMVKLAPSFAALSKYVDFQFPKQPSRSQVELRSVTAHVVGSVGDLGVLPETAAREVPEELPYEAMPLEDVEEDG